MKAQIAWTKKTKAILLTLLVCVPTVSALSYHYSIVDTNYLGAFSYSPTTDYHSLAASQWTTPAFQETAFAFEVETGDPSGLWWENITHSVNYHQMGTTAWFKANATEWGEWGYSFHHLTGGTLDGAGVRHYGGFPTPPATKQEAYAYMRHYVTNFTRHLKGDLRPWISFNGHYPYHHYAAEFGFDAIGTEIGENMESYQILMAFNRGAARQYQLPWFVDVSAWYGAGFTEYNSPLVFPDYGGPDHGHSLSLYNRSYYMAYMAGASRVIAEGGALNYFNRSLPADPDGLMAITPLGEVGKAFSHFTQVYPDRGIPYTPVALYLDQFHGTVGFAGNNVYSAKKAFNAIPYTRGDQMTFALLDMLFPGGWFNQNDERCQLVNNEFGDLFDVILQNASDPVLASYPVIVMSGDITLSPEEASALVTYVSGGGTLVVNSAYFPGLNLALNDQPGNPKLHMGLETVKVQTHKGGHFILYGGDHDPRYLLPILRELKCVVSPFQITTRGPLGSPQGRWGATQHVQSLINRNENGWVLTLINNDGIQKSPRNAPIIDPHERKEVTISLNPAFFGTGEHGQEVAHVRSWVEDRALWTASAGPFSSLTLSLGPGELTIVEFQCV